MGGKREEEREGIKGSLFLTEGKGRKGEGRVLLLREGKEGRGGKGKGKGREGA